jgi:hypothetical protein
VFCDVTPSSLADKCHCAECIIAVIFGVIRMKIPYQKTVA